MTPPTDTPGPSGQSKTASAVPKVRHLYVHIPFCHRICPYCSFHKHTPGNHDIPRFLAAVAREAEAAAATHDLSGLRTVYFGGGTPTLPSRRALEPFLGRFLDVLGRPSPEEFTFEANPRTFDESKIQLLLDHGVSRISLGVQSWDEAVLAMLGRDHAPAEAREAYEILRKTGTPQVNLDLMFSIPGQTPGQWEQTLRTTVEMGPDHVSAYNLNYEEDTEYFQRLTAGEFVPDDEQDARFFERAVEVLSAGGLEPYEVSNYARTGFQSVHNRAYWEGADYIGLGPGAFSTVAGRRWKNVSDTGRYTLEVESHAGSAAADEVEELSAEQTRTERVALLARTTAGVPKALLDAAGLDRIAEMVGAGLAVDRGDRVVLTPRGRLVADSATLHLLGH